VKGFDKAKIRTVVVDLDDTIMDKGELCPGAPEILGKIAGSGIEVVVATGRQRVDIPQEVYAMPFLKYIVTINGACVSDYRENKYISKMPLDPALVADILNITKGKTNYESVLSDDLIFASKACIGNLKARFIREYVKVRIGEIEAILRAVDSPAEHIRENSIAVGKMVFSFTDPGTCKEVWTALHESFDVEAVVVGGIDIELTAAGVNKGAGVSKLAEYLGFSMSEVLAIGDSGNDAEMLKAVGFSIAMGNAPEEVKKTAHLIAPHINQNGAVKILEQLFYNE
jgi:hypothetical protein